MVVNRSVMARIIREGMDDYWRVVYSKTDDGLSATELKWKRDHKRDLARLENKFGPQFDRIFGKGNGR